MKMCFLSLMPIFLIGCSTAHPKQTATILQQEKTPETGQSIFLSTAESQTQILIQPTPTPSITPETDQQVIEQENQPIPTNHRDMSDKYCLILRDAQNLNPESDRGCVPNTQYWGDYVLINGRRTNIVAHRCDGSKSLSFSWVSIPSGVYVDKSYSGNSIAVEGWMENCGLQRN